MDVNNVDNVALVRDLSLNQIQELLSNVFNMQRHPQATEEENMVGTRLCNLPINVALNILNFLDVDTILNYCTKFEEILDGLRTHGLPAVTYEFNLAHCSVKIPQRNFQWRAGVYLRHPENMTFQCLHVLMSILPGTVEELSANVLNFEDITDFFLMRNVKKFVLYPIRAHRQQPNPNPEKLSALLNQLPALETLDIATGDVRGCDKFYTVDHVKVVRAHWLDLDVLRRMQNKTISLSQNNISKEVFTHFLEMWQTGEFPKLEMIRLGLSVVEWPLEEIVRSVGGKQWLQNCKTRQQWYFPPGVKPTSLIDAAGYPYLQEERRYGLDLTDAWDITRTTTDGKTVLASVVNKGCQVIMIVWEEPFPSREFVPELKNKLAEMEALVESGNCPEADLVSVEHRIYDHKEILNMLMA